MEPMIKKLTDADLPYEPEKDFEFIIYNNVLLIHKLPRGFTLTKEYIEAYWSEIKHPYHPLESLPDSFRGGILVWNPERNEVRYYNIDDKFLRKECFDKSWFYHIPPKAPELG